jgi:hypothetical protein
MIVLVKGRLSTNLFGLSTAETLEPLAVFRIEKQSMIRSLREQAELS